MHTKPKLLVLSGPSCVGKSPLVALFQRLFPTEACSMKKLVLWNDRPPRPGERDGYDYHFRSRNEIEKLRNQKGYLVIEVRKDLQAVELDAIHRIVEQGKTAFYEGAPYVVSALLEAHVVEPSLVQSVFISPLSKQELLFLQAPERNVNISALVEDIMRTKLLRRKQKQVGFLTQPDWDDIEIRCRSAYREMQLAHHYDYVIPNHDGEDSEHWNAFSYPIGEAFLSLLDFVSILRGQPSARIEKWDENLLPPLE